MTLYYSHIINGIILSLNLKEIDFKVFAFKKKEDIVFLAGHNTSKPGALCAYCFNDSKKEVFIGEPGEPKIMTLQLIKDDTQLVGATSSGNFKVIDVRNDKYATLKIFGQGFGKF
jgi:hypothetical protein